MCNIFFSVFSEQLRIYYPLLYSLSILIRRSYPSSMLFSGQNNQYPASLFIGVWHLTSRGTFLYRTVSEFQDSSQTLRLFVVHSALLLSSVYSARILEEFHLIHLDLSPTIDSLHRFVVTANHLSTDY